FQRLIFAGLEREILPGHSELCQKVGEESNGNSTPSSTGKWAKNPMETPLRALPESGRRIQWKLHSELYRKVDEESNRNSTPSSTGKWAKNSMKTPLRALPESGRRIQ
ncbi:hypothetical protein BgiMline_007426, partial [Biomphalaria glabrata]